MKSPTFFFSQDFLDQLEFRCHRVTLPISAKEVVRILIGIMLHLYISLQFVSTRFFFFDGLVWIYFIPLALVVLFLPGKRSLRQFACKQICWAFSW